MATDNFWSNPKQTTPAVSMLSPPTTGDQQANPILHMPGTIAGAIPAAYTAAAQAVYPWAYDATEPVRPYDDTFPSWHSRQQINYLAKNGDVSIPPGSLNPSAYYTVSTDKTAVINLMSLTVTDYQRLPLADRQKLESIPVFTQTVAVTLGLVTDRSSIVSTLNKIRNGDPAPSALSTLPPADQSVFEQQLLLIQRRMASSPRIAVGSIEKQLADIAARIGRAAAFASVQPQVNLRVQFEGVDGYNKNDPDSKYGNEGNFYASFETEVRGRVISSDDNATVSSGYQSFMRLERDILNAQLRREALARTNITFYDPKNDVAQLIYQLQLLYQTESSSISDAGTEEMSQLHRLLADYAVMQRLVNETLKAFDPKKQDEKRRFLNLGGKQDGSVDTNQMIGTTGLAGQDTRLTYDWADGFQFDVNLGPRDTTGFQGGQRYGWYLLGGTIDNPLISNNQLYRYDKDRILQPVPMSDVTIAKRYSAFGDASVAVKTGGLTKEEMRIVAMFSKDVWASGTFPQTHPIEQLYNVTRATTNLTSEADNDGGSLRLERRDYWDKWSTQLSDNVTLLNQKNQLKQNEIENATKEANRHFDLGTNALKKMNEMLMAIGRM